MLEEFLHRHDLDIVLLQEVTNGEILDVKGYHTITNIGTSLRGTAILHKLNMKLNRVERLQIGRGISAYFGDTCFVNIYAPLRHSKTNRKGGIL